MRVVSRDETAKIANDVQTNAKKIEVLGELIREVGGNA
jgi:hypothetical protein